MALLALSSVVNRIFLSFGFKSIYKYTGVKAQIGVKVTIIRQVAKGLNRRTLWLSRCVILWGVVMLIAATANANTNLADASLNWNTLHGEHFRIHFVSGRDESAKRILSIAEKVHHRLSTIFEVQLNKPTDITLMDSSQGFSGRATPIPSNRIHIVIYPYKPFEHEINYLEHLLLHEYAHILHGSKISGIPAALQKLIGRQIYLFPQFFQPLWLTEGLAEYMAQSNAGVIDKSTAENKLNVWNSAMRTELLNDFNSLSKINLPPSTWPSGLSVYLYGSHFYYFLAKEYGEDKIIDLLDGYSNNIIPYFVNTNAKSVFGKKLPELWKEFEEHLQQQYAHQLKVVRDAGVNTGHLIEKAHVAAPTIMPDGTLYYLKNTGYRRTVLTKRLPNGDVENVANIIGNSTFDVHSAAGIIISQPEVCKERDIFFDLYHLNSDNKLKRLTHCARLRSVSWRNDGLAVAAVKVDVDRPLLVLLDAKGELIKTFWQGEPGEIIQYLDWSANDTKIMAARKKVGQPFTVQEYDIAEGKWTGVISINGFQFAPRYSAEGDAILFTSDVSNDIYNLYQLTRSEGRESQLLQLTNVETGVKQGVQVSPMSDFYFLIYGKDGFELNSLQWSKAFLKASDFELSINLPMQGQHSQSESSSNENSSNENSLIVTDYSVWPSIVPTAWMPSFITGDTGTRFEVAVSGSDVLQFHRYAANIGYDSSYSEPVGSVDYIFQDWLIFDGEKTVSRGYKSDLAKLVLLRPFTRMSSSWTGMVGAISYRNKALFEVDGSPFGFKDNSLGMGLSFDNAAYTRYSVTQTEGRVVSLIWERSSTNYSSDFNGEIFVFDWREYFPITETDILSFRFVRGTASDGARDFVLGDNDANSSLSSESRFINSSRFGDRFYALRGYSLGDSGLVGREMLLSTLEWRFPIRWIERSMMAPPMGAQRITGVVFAETGSAWIEGREGSDEGDYKSSIGVELHLRAKILYSVGLELRWGYVVALGDDTATSTYFSTGFSF